MAASSPTTAAPRATPRAIAGSRGAGSVHGRVTPETQVGRTATTAGWLPGCAGPMPAVPSDDGRRRPSSPPSPPDDLAAGPHAAGAVRLRLPALQRRPLGHGRRPELGARARRLDRAPRGPSGRRRRGEHPGRTAGDVGDLGAQPPLPRRPARRRAWRPRVPLPPLPAAL